MNKSETKFDLLVEEVTSRYQQGGLVTGDFVLIRKDALKNEKLKGRPSNFIEKLKEIIATNLPLRVSAVKSERPESSNDLIGGANHSGTNYWVDVCIEYAPGLWRDPMTLPLEVLDINNPPNYNLPSWPDSVKRDNKLEIKPAKIEKNKKELNIKQTQGDQRALDTKNVKIPVGKVKDGRDQTKVKESMDSENDSNEQISSDDFVLGTNGFKYFLNSEDYGHLGVFNEYNTAIKRMKQWADKNNHYPTLWEVSDHGNVLGTIDYSKKIEESLKNLSDEERMEEVLNEGLYSSFDYFTLGSTPADEPAAQVGKHDPKLMRAEVIAYINQLKRMFPNETPNAYFKIKRESHEFGDYYEAAINYNTEVENAVEFAMKVESNIPSRWDEEAKAELDKVNYFQQLAD